MSVLHIIALAYICWLLYCIVRLSASRRPILRSAFFELYATSLILEFMYVSAEVVKSLILTGTFPVWAHSLYTTGEMFSDSAAFAMLCAQLVRSDWRKGRAQILSINRFTAVYFIMHYKSAWSSLNVMVLKFVLWMLVAGSHFYMLLFAELRYQDGFLIGYNEFVEELNNWYRGVTDVALLIPSLILDIATVIGAKDSEQDFSALVWHNMFKNLAILPVTLYHVAVIIQQYCNCAVSQRLMQTLKWSDFFGRHTSIFLMLVCSRHVRTEVFSSCLKSKQESAVCSIRLTPIPQTN